VTAPAPSPSSLARPQGLDLVLMTVAILAISTSAPLIAATAAPALAIAFWRTAFGTLAIGPYVLLRHRRELLGLSSRERRLAVVSGVLLALHFATWVPSLMLTSVASSTALVATQPIWAALIARAGGHRVPRQAWTGMAIAFTGVLVITGVDVTLSGRAVVGDLLALVGGFFAAAYVTVGAQVRRTVSTATYTLLCYGVCALALLGACLIGRQQVVGFSANTWAKLVLLTLGAQLLGHSLFNVVLKRVSPMLLSLLILFEMPGAAIIAALWLGQVPPKGVFPAAALVLVGVAVVIRAEPGTPADQP